MIMVRASLTHAYRPKRPSYPALSRPSTPPRELPEDLDTAAPPATLGAIMDDTGDVIMGGCGVLVPPSPGSTNTLFDQTSPTPAPPPLLSPKAKMRVALQDSTGAGIKKAHVKSKSPGWKWVDATTGMTAAPNEQSVQEPFRFMHLPGGKQSILS
jgi:hypothetical protein